MVTEIPGEPLHTLWKIGDTEMDSYFPYHVCQFFFLEEYQILHLNRTDEKAYSVDIGST